MKLYTKYNAFIVSNMLKKYNIICTVVCNEYIEIDDNKYDDNILSCFITSKRFIHKVKLQEYYVFVFMPYCSFIDSYLIHNKYGKMHYICENICKITFTGSDYNISVNIIMCHIHEMYEYVQHLYTQCLNKEIHIDTVDYISKHYVYKKTSLSIEFILYKVFAHKCTSFNDIIDNYCYRNCILNIFASKKYNITIKGSTDISDSKKYIDKMLNSLNTQNKDTIISYIKYAQSIYSDIIVNDTIIYIRATKKIQHIPIDNLNIYETICLLSNIEYIDDIAIKFIKRMNKLIKKSVNKRTELKHFSENDTKLLLSVFDCNITHIGYIIKIFNDILSKYYIVDLYNRDMNIFINAYNHFKYILIS